MKPLCALAAFVLLAGSAAAQTAAPQRPERLPVGPFKTERDLESWERRYLDVAGWERLAWTEDEALYANAEGFQRGGAQGSIRLWIRTENRQPDANTGALSDRALWEFDCDERGYRILAADVYAAPNLAGEARSIDNPKAVWQFGRPGSVGESLLDQVCGLVEAMQEQTAEASQPIWSVKKVD